MADPVNFTRPAAERIARVVRTVEFGTRDSSGRTLVRPWYSGSRGGGGGLRLGKFGGSWLKGATKTVTQLKGGDGTPVSPAQTFQAKNYLTDISVDCGDRKCVCASIDGTWVLIAAEC